MICLFTNATKIINISDDNIDFEISDDNLYILFLIFFFEIEISITLLSCQFRHYLARVFWLFNYLWWCSKFYLLSRFRLLLFSFPILGQNDRDFSLKERRFVDSQFTCWNSGWPAKKDRKPSSRLILKMVILWNYSLNCCKQGLIYKLIWIIFLTTCQMEFSLGLSEAYNRNFRNDFPNGSFITF